MITAISDLNPRNKQVWLGPSTFIVVKDITGFGLVKQG